MSVVVTTGNGLDLNDLILLVVAVLTLYNNIIARKNHTTIQEVNRAVNHVEEPNAPTLREAVEEVKEKVSTPDPATPPIGQAVEDIAHALESAPHATDPKGPTK